MKFSVKPQLLKFLVLGMGGLGLALRILLYATGMDEKGLLVEGHWARTGIWLLTAVAALTIVLFTRPIEGPVDHRDCYPVSIAGGLGALAIVKGLNIRKMDVMYSASILLVVLVQIITVFGGRITRRLDHKKR